MANIYISSTFKDLTAHRKKAFDVVTALGHTARAMEYYTAGNRRPIEQCLQDVDACDVYIGIFAFRYGYIPDDPVRNPQRLSMTELEYRRACEKGKIRLIFLASEAGGSLTYADAYTHEGDNGERIGKLRKELSTDLLVQFFDHIGDLGLWVSTSVSREVPSPLPPAPPPARREPLFRQLTTHVLLAYSEVDAASAQAWSAALQARGLTVRLAPKALLAETLADVRDLEADAVRAHAAVVLRPPATDTQLTTREAAVRRVTDLLEARTGCLITLTDAVPANGVVPEDQVARVITDLEAACPELGGTVVVGLPFVVLAMNSTEAQAAVAPLDQLGLPSAAAVARYQPSRLDWRPFGGEITIRHILRDIAGRLNARAADSSSDRQIKLQYYPIDPLLASARDPVLMPIYTAIKQLGCVAIVDEISLLHPTVGQPLLAFQSQQQVSVITIAPRTHAPDAVEEALTRTRQLLDDAYVRFEQELDPSCEFGVQEERALKRWLHSSLPNTVLQMREPPPNRGKLSTFRESLKEQRIERQGYGDAVFREGGGP